MNTLALAISYKAFADMAFGIIDDNFFNVIEVFLKYFNNSDDKIIVAMHSPTPVGFYPGLMLDLTIDEMTNELTTDEQIQALGKAFDYVRSIYEECVK